MKPGDQIICKKNVVLNSGETEEKRGDIFELKYSDDNNPPYYIITKRKIKHWMKYEFLKKHFKKVNNSFEF